MLEDKNFASFSFRRMSTLEPGVNVKLSDLGGDIANLIMFFFAKLLSNHDWKGESNPGSLHLLGSTSSDEPLVKEVAEEPGVEGATFST